MNKLLILAAAFSLLACKDSRSDKNNGQGGDATESQRTISKRKLKGDETIVIETSMGTIKAKLHADTAPITVDNFLQYVDDKHYDGTIFHRVIANFMIQGGGFELKDEVPTEKPTRDGIENESPSSRPNLKGTLAMARTPEPHSASAQFFINVKDNPNLDHPKEGEGYGYAVFGEVIEGMDVVEKIRRVQTGSGYMNSIRPDGRISAASHNDVPFDPVIIKSIRRAAAR